LFGVMSVMPWCVMCCCIMVCYVMGW